MPGQRKPKEKPFISIEEDVKPLGYSVHHEGMTKKAASKLVKTITELGLGIDVDMCDPFVRQIQIRTVGQ